MLVYQDLLTGDELLSDSFPYKELCDGVLWEVEGKWVVTGAVDVDIGANPSAEEGGEDEGVDDTAVKVVDIVDTFRLQGLVGGVESKDWLMLCESLNDVRRFALFHFNILQPLLEKVLLVIVKAMKNPRSALCKTSIMASSDIFKAAGDNLLESTDSSNAFEQVMLQLLLKASQDKKFVCEEADKALKTMVDSLTPLPLLQKLKANVSHSNMRIRAKAAVSISNCVCKMEQEEMKEFGLIELIQIAASMLKDRLPEAREAARKIIVSLYEAVTKDEEEKQEIWQSFCQENLSAIDALAMVKLVSS